MAIRDKQKLITAIVSSILGEQPEYTSFDWLINRHTKEHFNKNYGVIENIFVSLNGQPKTKLVKKLQPDAYFAGGYNFLFEFDEFQHFSSSRQKALSYYPKNLKLNYSLQSWVLYCQQNSAKADKYRYNKKVADFNFEGGRTCQRAYFDCFRDLLPVFHGLNPTLRISAFEVDDITENNRKSMKIVERLLAEKIKYT
jgi:hypothetical protein